MKITLLTGKTYKLENAFDFPIEIHQSPRATKLSLKIDSKRRIPVLTIPIFCSEKQALKFVEKNLVWIKNTLFSIPEIKHFENGEKISLFGENVEIVHTPELKGGTRVENQKLLVGGDADFLHSRVKAYIKQEAKRQFLQISREIAKALGVEVKIVTIKDTKSRWGSCSSLHNINYNWRIALAPDFVIRYLISHEVSHLLHPDHSTAFWHCVETVCPDMKHGNVWLKKFGKNLNIYE